MSDKTTSTFGHEFKRLIEEFETSGHLEETAKEKGLAVLNLLRDIVRLRLKHFPKETIPVDDDREFAEWLSRLNDPNPEHATLEAFLKRIGRDPSAAIAYLERKTEIVSARQSVRGGKERPRSQDIFFHIIQDYLDENPSATQGEVLQYLKESDGIILLDGSYRHVSTELEVTDRALKHRIYRAKKKIKS